MELVAQLLLQDCIFVSRDTQDKIRDARQDPRLLCGSMSRDCQPAARAPDLLDAALGPEAGNPLDEAEVVHTQQAQNATEHFRQGWGPRVEVSSRSAPHLENTSARLPKRLLNFSENPTKGTRAHVQFLGGV